MPLNFSSTRSQMILLLKYWTGSHWKGTNITMVRDQLVKKNKGHWVLNRAKICWPDRKKNEIDFLHKSELPSEGERMISLWSTNKNKSNLKPQESKQLSQESWQRHGRMSLPHWPPQALGNVGSSCGQTTSTEMTESQGTAQSPDIRWEWALWEEKPSFSHNMFALWPKCIFTLDWKQEALVLKGPNKRRRHWIQMRSRQSRKVRILNHHWIISEQNCFDM